MNDHLLIPAFATKHRTAIAIGCLCVLVGAFGKCSGSTESGRNISYQETARLNYLKGMAELKDENFPDALKYFLHLKSKFPFSQYATWAELRIADTYYAEGKYLEAIDAYRQFLKFHPTQPMVANGYVSYRICSANVEQIPSDWFLVPPSYEKDQGAAREAMRELVFFKRTYPKSEYLPKVEILYRDCINRLSDHELYVAKFYLDRDRPKAAILRLETLLAQYPDEGVDAKVMFLLGQTYLKMNDRQKAKYTFSKLVTQYPRDNYSAKAHVYLQQLVR